MADLALAHGPIAFVVRADPLMLAWLEEFLAPAFSRASAPDPRAILVTFETDSGAHARLHVSLRNEPIEHLEGVSFDGRFSHLASWTDEQRWTWAFDDERDVFHGVAPGRREFRVVAQNEDGARRVAFMRVVRELATSAWLRAGFLPIHGAAFAHDGAVTLVCGRKHSGKTSVLVHALQNGATYVANDRVFASVDAPVVAHAMPTIVAIREGTLDRFPRLRAAYDTARYDRGRTIAECGPGVVRPGPRTAAGADRPGITPAQFCDLLGVPMSGGGPVRTLVFPRLDPGAHGIEVRTLTSADAAVLLRESLMRASAGIRGSALFALDGVRESISADEEARRCRALTSNVRAVACRLGPRAYETDLVAALDRRS